MQPAQATERDLRVAHDRAAALAAEKEQEVTVAREAIVARDHQLQDSARTLAERTAACATLDAELELAQETVRNLRIAHDRASAGCGEAAEITVAREAIGPGPTAAGQQLQEPPRRAAGRARPPRRHDQAPRWPRRRNRSRRGRWPSAPPPTRRWTNSSAAAAEMTATRQQLATHGSRTEGESLPRQRMCGRVTELEQRLARDEDTVGDCAPDLASWQD
ncbi:MAG: hypothetical protein IPI27_18410 [Betaproteobacteria bacterium]|nr:hypothetical protein [Betaproteobacteria bacterium]